MSNALQPDGPRFVSGRVEPGQIILTRDDGTTQILPDITNIHLTAGTLIDNGDGTFTLDIPEA